MGFYDVGLQYDPKRATPRTLTDNGVRDICSVAGWNGKGLDCAIRVVIAESSKQTAVTSSNPAGGENIGIFQIWQGNVRYPDHLKDPVYSANVARRMWLADGGTFSKRWETAAKGNLPDSPKLQDDATNPTDNVTRPLSTGLDAIGDLANKVMSAAFWKNAGFVILGGVFLVVAVLIMAAEFMRSVPTPVNTAIKAVK